METASRAKRSSPSASTPASRSRTRVWRKKSSTFRSGDPKPRRSSRTKGGSGEASAWSRRANGAKRARCGSASRSRQPAADLHRSSHGRSAQRRRSWQSRSSARGNPRECAGWRARSKTKAGWPRGSAHARRSRHARDDRSGQYRHRFSEARSRPGRGRRGGQCKNPQPLPDVLQQSRPEWRGAAVTDLRAGGNQRADGLRKADPSRLGKRPDARSDIHRLADDRFRASGWRQARRPTPPDPRRRARK